MLTSLGKEANPIQYLINPGLVGHNITKEIRMSSALKHLYLFYVKNVRRTWTLGTVVQELTCLEKEANQT